MRDLSTYTNNFVCYCCHCCCLCGHPPDLHLLPIPRKPDRISPVDNRTSTKKRKKKREKERKKKKKWPVTRYMWHVTRYMWHITCDTWHVTCDTWWVVNILSKCQIPSSYALGVKVFWRFGGKGWPTNLINDTGIWQTRCNRGCPTNSLVINWLID